jgi:hypothetical protein
MSDTFTVIVHLPQPIDAVSNLLRTIHENWPDAVIDVTGAWKIEVPACE